MNSVRIWAVMVLLCTATVLVPGVSAVPVPGSGNCTGDGREDPSGKWESCWGVHYDDAGYIDCVGQYLDTYASPDNCVGVRP